MTTIFEAYRIEPEYRVRVPLMCANDTDITIELAAIGGGTVGEKYTHNGWAYAVRQGGHVMLTGDDLRSNATPASHADMARTLASFLAHYGDQLYAVSKGESVEDDPSGQFTPAAREFLISENERFSMFATTDDCACGDPARAEYHAHIVIGRTVFDERSVSGDPHDVGTETSYLNIYVCEVDRQPDAAYVPDGWEILRNDDGEPDVSWSWLKAGVSADDVCLSIGDTVYLLADGPQTGRITDLSSDGITVEIENVYGDGGVFTVECPAADVWAHEHNIL